LSRSSKLRPLLFSAAAVLLGAPAYLALARFTSPPPAVLDRPWPLAVAVGVVTLAAARVAARKGSGSRVAHLGAAVVGVLSLLALDVVSTRPLPASSPEVHLGLPLPDVRLTDEAGRAVPLSSLRGHPLVLVFYRGGLCVACRAQLSDLAGHARSFIAAGVRVFGVSADPPPVSAEWKRTLGLPFSLLSDDQRGVAESLCSARAHCLLLVDPEGVVRWGALNDYWRGAEPSEAVLLAAYRLAAR